MEEFEIDPADLVYDDDDDEEAVAAADYEEQIYVDDPAAPQVNLQANMGTLSCLRWLLSDQKDVSYETTAVPVIEKYECDSSDEEIWQAMSAKEKDAPIKYPEINMTCEWKRCNAQFLDRTEYRMHIEKHLAGVEDPEDGEYVCEWDLCDFKTSAKELYTTHVLHHEMHGRFLAKGESRELAHKVPKCMLSGLYRNRLPKVPAEFVCHWAECGKAYLSNSRLHDHLKEDHLKPQTANNQFNCKWQGCTYLTNSKMVKYTHLKEHMRVHVQIYGMACRKCGHTRKAISHFLKHFLSQAPAKNPELCCPHCNALFLKETTLKRHIKERHLSVPCDICNQCFRSDYQMRTHVAMVHVKLRPFKCPKCPKAFFNSTNLAVHMTVHDVKEDGHPCKLCEYVGKTFLGLRKHMYDTHANRNYPYECHLCGEQFKQHCSIKSHFEKVHQLPVPKGFHRYTYRLEDGPVYRLVTEKSYANPQDFPTKRPKKAEVAKPVQLNVNLNFVANGGEPAKVELDIEKPEDKKKARTRPRRAKKAAD